jgi:hypothetical protein
MLIKHDGFELRIDIQKASYFHQLSEVCENAAIYNLVDPSLALTPSLQLLFIIKLSQIWVEIVVFLKLIA